MICPGCQKDNDPKRRYCGRCGTNFHPVCRRCSFGNASDDRYCGGCGANLVASEGVHVKHVTMPESAVAHAAHAPGPASPAMIPMPPPVPMTAVPMKAVMTAPGDELSGLFSSPSTAAAAINDVALPETGVSQDDLDRLFGVAL